MRQARIVVVGSCNMDIYTWTDHLPERGETVIGDRYWMGMGGKGANQAVGARRLGAQVDLVGRMGTDLFATKMLETLKGHGVCCDHIQADPEVGSGVALVVVEKSGEDIIAVIPGANMRLGLADVNAAADLIRQADVLMTQLEIPLETVERAIDIAREGQALVILNPAPARPIPDRVLQKAHLLTPNQSEASALTGIDADTREGAEAAGKALLSKGVQTVVLTLGAQGALIIQPDKTVHVQAAPVDPVDTSGAGDAFMGGLGVALGEGKSLEEATRFANLTAALSTTKPGAMPAMPLRQEVETFALGLSSAA